MIGHKYVLPLLQCFVNILTDKHNSVLPVNQENSCFERVSFLGQEFYLICAYKLSSMNDGQATPAANNRKLK